MKKAGKAVSVLMAAVLTAGITSPAVFAASAPYVQSDTTIDFTVPKSNTYAFKFTIHGSHSCPKIVAGNGAVLRTENVTKRIESGNDTYYFKVRAIGSYGQSSAIYTTLPGQKAVKHCTVEVGVKHNKSYEAKDGYLVSYYDGTVRDSSSATGYREDTKLAVNRKKQYLIDYMTYLGYTYDAALDSLNVNNTPTSWPLLDYNDYSEYDNYKGDYDTRIESGIKACGDGLAKMLTRYKTTEYGVKAIPVIFEKQDENLIPIFHSNLNYTVNPEPDFTSKFCDGAEGGKNLGCNNYACSRGYEITGIAAGVGMSDLEDAADGVDSFTKLQKDGFSYGYEPKKDAIVYESNSWMDGIKTGHWEYVEAVDGDSVTVSGANSTGHDNEYYGRVVRTKKELQDLGAVYLYLK